MSLRRYLTSRIFFVQVLSAIAIILVIGYLFMHWLTYATNHGEVIKVPNLARLTEDQVEEKLEELNLNFFLDYFKEIPNKSDILFQTFQSIHKNKIDYSALLKYNLKFFDVFNYFYINTFLHPKKITMLLSKNWRRPNKKDILQPLL